MEDEEQFEADRSDPEYIFKQLSLDVRGNNYRWIEIQTQSFFNLIRIIYIIIVLVQCSYYVILLIFLIYSAFYWHSIPRIQMPGHFEFYREYVAKNRPVIITGT